MTKYIGIAAVCENGGIGYKDHLLVHIKKDLKRFKELTWGKTVVYGRKTLYSFPKQKTLPGRTNLVLSKTLETYDGADVLHSLDDLKKYAEVHDLDEVWVLGGSSVYEQLLPYMSELYLTKVSVSPVSDAFFPVLDTCWSCCEKGQDEEENGIVFCFERWIKQ